MWFAVGWIGCSGEPEAPPEPAPLERLPPAGPHGPPTAGQRPDFRGAGVACDGPAMVAALRALGHFRISGKPLREEFPEGLQVAAGETRCVGRFGRVLMPGAGPVVGLLLYNQGWQPLEVAPTLDGARCMELTGLDQAECQTLAWIGR